MSPKAPARLTTRPAAVPVVLPIVTKVMRSVATRLSRMEALLIEMRHEQDVQLKRIAALHVKVESLAIPVRRAKRR